VPREPTVLYMSEEEEEEEEEEVEETEGEGETKRGGKEEERRKPKRGTVERRTDLIERPVSPLTTQ
jgi:hypothetical protein